MHIKEKAKCTWKLNCSSRVPFLSPAVTNMKSFSLRITKDISEDNFNQGYKMKFKRKLIKTVCGGVYLHAV